MSNATAQATPYGTLPPASPVASRKPISLPRLHDMRTRGEKITMLTAYDATFAAVADAAGVECILVGDSLGMVCQGLASTVGVTLETMRYHVESVVRGLQRVQGTAWVIGDLPFGTYHASQEQALHSASVLMQAGAHMVKLEGGGWTCETVRFLVERGIPVCAHLGLTPQTVHALGGYRVQGATMPVHNNSNKMRWLCKTQAPACWCWKWCPPPCQATSRKPCHIATRSALVQATAPPDKCW